MKYPFTNELTKKAKEYAEKAHYYTHKHYGFEGTTKDQQIRRWVVGGVAQNIIEKFCNINNIECISDSTTYKQNDKFDLIINGFIFDIKSTNANIPCQVNDSSMKKAKNGETHCFYFVKFDRDFKWYEPIGFSTIRHYFTNCTKVENGQVIPGTNIKNKFKTTYVMSEKDIQHKGIDVLAKIRHRKFNFKDKVIPA